MPTKGCVTRSDCGQHHGSGFKKQCLTIFLLVLNRSDGGQCDCRRIKYSTACRVLFAVLLAFVFIVLLVILIIFLVLQPHKPRFYLQDATVHELNISDGMLTSNLQFNVVSHNPNDRIGVIYDSLSTYASYLGEQITGECPEHPFYQDQNDINVLAPNLYGNTVPLAPAVCEHLNYELQNGLLSFTLKMDGRIRWKVGSWTSGHYHLNVNCWAILGMNSYNIGVQAPLQPGTRCHVEV